MAPCILHGRTLAEEIRYERSHGFHFGSLGSLQALIGAYLDAVQSGRPVDRETWLAAHPDLADGLRTFLADYDRFQELAAPLRDVAGAAAGAASTVSHEGTGFSLGSGSSPDMTSEGGVSAAPPASGTRVRYFGDYELLRTLGEGGMGIVYEARQRSLDRIVALKMIRAGRFAGEEDLRRFRNEAEAVAKLDHPHIVPVYEVGEHEGHHYFSMKRIDGTSLAANLSGYRDRPREAARLVATVAKALHHAHQRGLLHRDLKPSNMLLDAKGEPHLTDFGLAKRLQGPGAAETTRTGAILGTPAYMAPEQASGQRGEVTTATDVYGLGALLYALLTGHAPFRGESVADTLLQVRERSPEPIRISNAKVPRDLETICVRCLEREPRRRYASADAVAEELERWLSGEPITARPVGKLERGWMWCQRNPVVAGLIGAVVVVLITGTAVSTVFAVRASNRAQAERIERIRAENAEKDTRKARDEIEGTFARSLLRPLDLAGDAKEVLSPTEVEALWELAGHGSGLLGLRLVDEATRSPMTTRQLCARSEPVLLAAVGLAQNKREQALKLLIGRLAETGLPLAQKADIALTALELTDRGGPETGACEQALAGAIKADLPAHLLAAWKLHLSLVVERLEPDRAGRLILLALHKETGAAELGNLALDLAKVASRLEPAKAAGVCGEALRLLTDALARETSDNGRRELAGGFWALAGRMPRGEAIRSLTEALGRVADSGARQRLAAGLGAVITAMSPDDVAEIHPVVARSLVDALSRESEANVRRFLARALATLAKCWRTPKPSDVRPVVQSLATALRAEKDPARRGQLAWALAPMAERLGPEESWCH
ncbi:MAG: protein kinase [Isosphaerales bacterium]